MMKAPAKTEQKAALPASPPARPTPPETIIIQQKVTI
jgi:hypothetical protein